MASAEAQRSTSTLEASPAGRNNSVCGPVRPSVSQFYKGRSVLITGATGFMGKVLIEKLLRSCPDIDTIFLLIRPNAKGSPVERLQLIFDCELFGVVRELYPDALQKLVAIPGDMLDEGLGVNKENILRMAETVSIVFHTAATVKFDEALKLSLELNVVGTKKIIELCRQLTHLEALVHVSTAYANCDRPVIAEQIYLPPAEPEMILSLLTGDHCNFPASTLERLSSRIVRGLASNEAPNKNPLTPLGSRPNTYTFTKALAEHVLYTNAKDLPVVIARPSIVGATWKEPLPGWIDNYNGPTGLLLAIGSGALRHMLGDCNAIADLIPVDLACNMLIVIAYETATSPKPVKGDIKVYHCSSGASGNATTWGQLSTLSSKNWLQHPTERLYRVPTLTFYNKCPVVDGSAREQAQRFALHETFRKFQENNAKIVPVRYLEQAMIAVDHWVPAYLFDFYQRLTGQRPRMVQLYQKLHKAVKTLEYFTQNQWIFIQDNTVQMREALSPIDAQDFDIDVRRVDWNDYVRNYCLGIKRFVLKEDLAKLPEARLKLQKRMGLVKQLAWGIVSMLVTAALTKLGLLRLLGLAPASGASGGHRSSSALGRAPGAASAAVAAATAAGLRAGDHSRDAASSSSAASPNGAAQQQAGLSSIVAYSSMRKVLLVVVRFCIHLLKILLTSSSIS